MEVPDNPEEQHQLLWKKQEECLRQQNDTHNSGYCNGIWDGILCWNDATPGSTVSQPCPAYFAGFNIEGEATRECLLDGSWFSLDGNSSWTNYTACLSHHYGDSVNPIDPLPNTTIIPRYVPMIKTISLVGYGVSLSTLVIAFIILASYKRLRCPRNVLHMHLFVSFMLRASLSLLKHAILVGGVPPATNLDSISSSHILDDIAHLGNNWGCKLMTTLWQYFIMANYSWILMEGLYLHNLIFLALFTDTSAITIYVVMGWGLPVLFVTPWAILRALYEDTLCWTTHENPFYFLYIKIPIILSIVINFALFVNIVRVLLLKLTASISEEKRRFRYRRWAKSTLVLVPLFGVHYAFFIWMSYSVGVNEIIELVWLFCDQSFASFQGFFVAILYCFMNGEVRAELNKSWRKNTRRWKLRGSPERPTTLSRILRRTRGSSTMVESCMTSFMSTVPDGTAGGSTCRRSMTSSFHKIIPTDLATISQMNETGLCSRTLNSNLMEE